MTTWRLYTDDYMLVVTADDLEEALARSPVPVSSVSVRCPHRHVEPTYDPDGWFCLDCRGAMWLDVEVR